MNNKGLIQSKIVYVILGIVTLVIILGFVYNVNEKAKYESSKLECREFMEQVDGKTIFFSEGRYPTYKFKDSVSSICPLKNVEVSKRDVSNVVELVDNCWSMMGAGVDFTGANTYGRSVCVLCGFVESKDDIEDFESEFVKKISDARYYYLKEKREIEGTNRFFFEEDTKGLVPKSIEAKNPVAVIYYIYRPEFEGDNESFVPTSIRKTYHDSKTSLSEFFSQSPNLLSAITELISGAGVNSIGGVFLQPWSFDENILHFKTNESISISAQNLGLRVNCDELIIPKNEFD